MPRPLPLPLLRDLAASLDAGGGPAAPSSPAGHVAYLELDPAKDDEDDEKRPNGIVSKVVFSKSSESIRFFKSDYLFLVRLIAD